MEKFLHSTHPVRCIITGPLECGKSVFLTNLILNIINKYDKVYIYSPSLHQDLYQQIFSCFSNYIPIHIIKNILNEQKVDTIFDEIIKKKDFRKSYSEIETFGIIEELKYPQDYDDGGIIILDDLNEKEMNNPRVQPTFDRSRHNN